MGFFKKIKKGFKKIVKGVSKAIKKVTKPIVKVGKKLWKGVQKVGGKIMKAINKAGIIGQIGLMLVMPYAFQGLGTLIGSAGGGIGATWTGFGNWANTMMGGSSAFAKTVGTIAKGIHSAGAIVGRGIQSVAGFIDKGFQAFSNATGLGNPIEGFSNAVKQGYADSFAATNNFLFSGTDFGATAKQLKSAGVEVKSPFDVGKIKEKVKAQFGDKVVDKQLPEINMEAMDFTKVDQAKFDIYGNVIDTVPTTDVSQFVFDPATGKMVKDEIVLRNLPTGETLSESAKVELREQLKIPTVDAKDLTLQLDTTAPRTFAQKAGDVLGTVGTVLDVVGKGKSVYDQFQEQEQAYGGSGFGQLGGEGRGIQDINFFRGQGQIGLNLNAYAYDMQRYAYG